MNCSICAECTVANSQFQHMYYRETKFVVIVSDRTDFAHWLYCTMILQVENIFQVISSSKPVTIHSFVGRILH